jgi:hypothetical protein
MSEQPDDGEGPEERPHPLMLLILVAFPFVIAAAVFLLLARR